MSDSSMNHSFKPILYNESVKRLVKLSESVHDCVLISSPAVSLSVKTFD